MGREPEESHFITAQFDTSSHSDLSSPPMGLRKIGAISAYQTDSAEDANTQYFLGIEAAGKSLHGLEIGAKEARDPKIPSVCMLESSADKKHRFSL